MKRIVPLICIVLLSGCSSLFPSKTTNVAMKFPDVPTELITACPDLKTVDPTTEKLSDVLTIVVDNYGTYYGCKAKVDNWIDWYNHQKSISDSLR